MTDKPKFYVLGYTSGYHVFKHTPGPLTDQLFPSVEAVTTSFPFITRDSDYVAREATWQERENIRIKRGYEGYTDDAYKTPIWHRERVWRSLGTPDACLQHYAHISTVNPALIAFTENPAKGERNVQTTMKPGRYLSKFYSDVLSEKQIKAYAEWHATGTRVDGGYVKAELKFARTAEEMEHVYTTGPKSCMSHHKSYFGDANMEHHPSAAYASGELAIAYLELDGKIIARSLVRESTSTYGRVYPTAYCWEEDGCESQDDSEARRTALMNALRALDMESLKVNSGGFEGAELALIPSHRGSGCYVMPYLDNDMQLDFDGDTVTMVSEGAYEGSSTSGYVRLEPVASWTCEHCEEGQDDNSNTNEVRVSGGRGRTECWW